MTRSDLESFADDDRRALIDVTDLSLVDVQALPESVIGDVLRRILADAESHVEPVAGFQSAI